MSGMILSSMTARAVTVPLRRPVIAAIGRYDAWPMVLIDLTTTDGMVGRSYVTPYRASAMPAIVAELHDIGDALVGSEISPVTTSDLARASLNVIGESGVSAIAISGLDMAIWDALGKRAGLPLVELLGGSSGSVEAYNSNGLWRHSTDTLAQEAAELVEEGGFGAVKLRLGNVATADDLAAIRAVRAGIGDRIDIMVDFNQALGIGDAIRRCHELDDEGLYWFEEPIDYSDVRGYAQLAASVRTPIQLGENHYGVRDLFDFLAAGATHYAMADLMRIGGVTGWLRAAGLAAGAGVGLSNHLYPEIAVHLMRVTPTANRLEWVDWANPVLADPLVPRDGRIAVPDRPGIGIEWDEAAVERYRVS